MNGTSHQDGSLIGSRLGRYEVRAELGRGGMGEVFRALDTTLDREVAIKLIPPALASDPDRVARFEREARTLAALQHPNVATVFGFEEVGSRRFLVMELVEGESLAQRLSRGPLADGSLIPIAIQIVDGLAAAHAKGIVHRDLKPANVMLSDQDRVKILDFGLARSAAANPAGTARDTDATMTREASLTRAGTVVGTIAYMSPEQALGRPVDTRSDLFSLGAMLYEMATGRRAFSGATEAAVIDALLRGEPTPPESGPDLLPSPLAGLVRRLLQRDPDRRPATAAGIRAQLVSLESAPPSPGSALDSIAVLPFASRSPDAEDAYFADGMAEEILVALSKIEALRVASRTSSFAYRDRPGDVREIARALNVSAVLEGSVRRVGRRLRVAVQLVAAADGFQLWSERFDRDLEDVFAVQDEIAASIALALRVVLSPAEKRAIRCVNTRNLEAYDLYLRGRSLLRSLTEERIVQAQYVFRRAVELDEAFAPAWLGLAEAAMWSYQWFDRSDRNLQTAAEASARALAIAPDMAEARVAQGIACWLRDEPEAAVEALEAAQRLDPKLFEAAFFLGRVHVTRGDHESAVASLLRAADLQPDDYQALAVAIALLRGMGRREEARDAARRTVEVVARHLERHPDDARAYYLGAGARSELGDRDAALEWSRRALEISPRDGGVLYNVACTFIQLGLVDEALELLERAAAEGWGNRSWLENDPDMDPVRDHPRFRDILHRIDQPRASESGSGRSRTVIL